MPGRNVKRIKKVNKENAPPDGWKASDAISKAINWGKLNDPKVLKQLEKIFEDKPEANKQYALTGGPGDKCISNGNSWKESEVNEKK